MAYPIIMNGDHAEFEATYKGKPEDRPDWPLPSFDARDWAAAFCKIATGLGYKDAEGKSIDEGWMVTWFANSLMRGYDEHASRQPALLKALDEISAMDPKGIRADDLGRAARIAAVAISGNQ